MSKSLLEEDVLAVEEPLEIRLEYGALGHRKRQSISITMRTPGNDFDLAAGFLFTEGMVRQKSDIERISYCGAQAAKGASSIVRVDLHPAVQVDVGRLQRHFYTSSSCGVCGKSSIEALKTQSAFQLLPNKPELPSELIHGLPSLLRAAQGVFNATGGLHGCALFSMAGELLSVCEDVGRHNALDKLIGRALLAEALPLSNVALLVSGRASFELVQKSAMAGIPIFLAVGAPSSLALELARDVGMSLVGFVRNERFNIYHDDSRILKAGPQ